MRFKVPQSARPADDDKAPTPAVSPPTAAKDAAKMLVMAHQTRHGQALQQPVGLPSGPGRPPLKSPLQSPLVNAKMPSWGDGRRSPTSPKRGRDDDASPPKPPLAPASPVTAGGKEDADDVYVASVRVTPIDEDVKSDDVFTPAESEKIRGVLGMFRTGTERRHSFDPNRDVEPGSPQPGRLGSEDGKDHRQLLKQGTTRGKWFAAKRLTSLARKEKTPEPEKPLEELITSEQVRTYHHLLQQTSSIKGLHSCVQHPCGNIYWDFKTQQCRPGRVWVEKMPDDIRAIVDRPFTDTEVEEIEEAIRLKEVPSQPGAVDPRAIFVIGPSAAGKSTIRTQTESHLQINLSDYVEIDGDEFRVKHEGWQRVLADKTTGYRDASNILLPYTRTLKKKFLSYAMEHRKNIILPSTGSNLEKLMKEVEMVRSHGYRVDVIGLVVSYREARARALNRAHENGRWNDGTWKKWEAAMHAITTLMDPEISDWCIIFDNQDFTSPSTIYSRAQSLTFVEGVIDAYRMQDKDHETGAGSPNGKTTQ